MGQFKHPNVVEMFGVVSEGEPVSMQIRQYIEILHVESVTEKFYVAITTKLIRRNTIVLQTGPFGP